MKKLVLVASMFMLICTGSFLVNAQGTPESLSAPEVIVNDTVVKEEVPPVKEEVPAQKEEVPAQQDEATKEKECPKEKECAMTDLSQAMVMVNDTVVSDTASTEKPAEAETVKA